MNAMRTFRIRSHLCRRRKKGKKHKAKWYKGDETRNEYRNIACVQHTHTHTDRMPCVRYVEFVGPCFYCCRVNLKWKQGEKKKHTELYNLGKFGLSETQSCECDKDIRNSPFFRRASERANESKLVESEVPNIENIQRRWNIRVCHDFIRVHNVADLKTLPFIFTWMLKVFTQCVLYCVWCYWLFCWCCSSQILASTHFRDRN